MISRSQICYNTPKFYTAEIFVKYCYSRGSWLFWIMNWYSLFGLLTARGKIIVKQDFSGRNNHSREFIFSCDQAALRTPLSVRLSVRLSVCLSICLSVTPFSICSCHRIITKFSWVITNDSSDVHAKGQGHRSKVKVTEVTTQLILFRTVTRV